MKNKLPESLTELFEVGEEVVLDEKYANSSKVKVVYQSPNRLFTTVKGGDSQWDVMTTRLTKIK